jgi:hypothetical protein
MHQRLLARDDEEKADCDYPRESNSDSVIFYGRVGSQAGEAGRLAGQRSTKVELFINLKTAKTLGLLALFSMLFRE